MKDKPMGYHFHLAEAITDAKERGVSAADVVTELLRQWAQREDEA
jgi:hypothetical protein